MAARWYFLHVNSNSEFPVQQSLRELADRKGMSDVIKRIIVPIVPISSLERKKEGDENRKRYMNDFDAYVSSLVKALESKEEIPLRNEAGERIEDIQGHLTNMTKSMSGYILLNMEMSSEAWQVVKNTPKVIGFLGPHDPLPSPTVEIIALLKQMIESVGSTSSAVSYQIGEKVRLIDGPFASFTGFVEDVDREKATLKVSVSIFGRATPVELEFSQVEKVNG